MSIAEWLGKKEEEHGFNPEFSKLQEKEVIIQRKSLKRRIVKNGISPKYDEEHSEVRHLTEEEIEKEYVMLDQVVKKKESDRGATIRELIKFLQALEGRKVSTDIIVQKTKKPVKSISSFLSQLFNAGIVARVPMKDHKRKFIWGIAIPYKDGELEAVISLFNDFTAQKRRDLYQKKKKREEEGNGKDVNYHSKEELKKEKEIDGYLEDTQILHELSPEEIKALDQRNQLKEENEKLKHELKSLTTPLPHDIRISVEGNIKILFGLAK